MNEQLNGSAGRFAAALSEIVRDAAQEAVEPLRLEMKAGFAGIDKELAEIRGEVAKELSEIRGEVAYARKQGELGKTP